MMNFMKIPCVCRCFSTSSKLCKPKNKAERVQKLMALKELRRKLKMKMVRKHPFNPNLPLTGKHVSPSRVGGSKELQEKVALHVVQPVGYRSPKFHNFVKIPEMVPEFIVPDLTDFKLKPYVPYNAPPIYQSKFTAKDLFDSCYAPEIEKDVRAGKITLESSKSSDVRAGKLTLESPKSSEGIALESSEDSKDKKDNR